MATVKHSRARQAGDRRAGLTPVSRTMVSNKYPSESGVDANVQSYRRLMGELGTINDLARDLMNPTRECHGTLHALRTRFLYGLELLDAIAPKDEETDED